MSRILLSKAFFKNAPILMLVLILTNCQERDDVTEQDNHAASQIHKDRIGEYWNQLKIGSNEDQLLKIDELSSAIDINSLKIYDLRTTEKLLVADLHSLAGLDGTGKIIFYLNQNKIVRSNIVTLMSNATAGDDNKVIQSVLNADQNGFNYSGEITFWTLSKIKMLYSKYDHGKVIENVTLSASRDNLKTNKTQGSCTEYWWVTRLGGEIISQVLLFIICDCSGGGGGGGGGIGEETSKMNNCNGGSNIFLGGSGASSTTSYKPNLPSNPIDKQTFKFTDPDGVCTEYIFNISTNSWQILQIILPNIIIPNNRDNYGILEFQWPVNNQKVFDRSTNLIYTYDQGSDSWIGVPANEQLIASLIEERIDGSQLDPCPKAILNKLKNTSNCDITNVLTKFSINAVYNVTIISGDTGSRPGHTVRDSKNNYTTTINNQGYTSSTQLYKAANILHEITHAFFLSLVDDYYGSDNPAVFNEFPVLFQTFVDKKYPGSKQDAHHEQMAETYVNAIGAALQEFQTGITPPNNVQPDQIYIDLAWGGLRDAPIFEKKFPAGTNERVRIDNRLAAEQSGHVIDAGTPQQQTPIGNPCN